MPLCVDEVHNGVAVSHNVVSDSTDPTVARAALRDHLFDTATVEYSVRVLEWWFSDRDNELRIRNGQDIDIWSWTNQRTR
jgi:hypothetical protein